MENIPAPPEHLCPHHLHTGRTLNSLIKYWFCRVGVEEGIPSTQEVLGSIPSTMETRYSGVNRDHLGSRGRRVKSSCLHSQFKANLGYGRSYLKKRKKKRLKVWLCCYCFSLPLGKLPSSARCPHWFSSFAIFFFCDPSSSALWEQTENSGRQAKRSLRPGT